MMQRMMGGMGGGMPGGMGGGDGPFSAASLAKLNTNPKIAKYFENPKFKNLFELCQQNPQMLMQVMQMDPRFMDVFSVLTGLDLNELQKDRAQQQEQEEE